MQASVTELPFNHFIGLQSAEAPHLLRLPAGDQYLNHVGTVHASAQLALAEASSGQFLLQHLGTTAGILPLVRRIDAKFRKPAKGAVKSSVSTPPETIDQLRAELASKGRALTTISIDLHDEAGNHTLSANVEWFVTRSD
jgi:acyl-coenzyme A thioesterase PaaI-like protein